MSKTYTPKDVMNALAAASRVLSSRKDEINKLNVFPVPDGDTGTNMSLTLESVVNNLAALPPDADLNAIRKAITTGALMGARGNSGVITSQILRGLCEGSVNSTSITTASIADAFQRAVEVAFQAVRKPVEGTILTVLRDSAAAAADGKKKDLSVDDDLQAIVAAAFESVKRTPDLLPVLKENGVVDSGGFGLAILFDAFVAALLGKEGTIPNALADAQLSNPKVEIQHFQDWEGANYRYCNEFLVQSDTLVKEDALDFLQTMGDCELVVGEIPRFKVHVHSNRPDEVLKYFLDRGQIFEVFIHNMDMQADERIEKIKADEGESESEHRAIGFVAVAAGEGNAKILESLGVEEVVSGGQTMNPSTKDILDAINRVNADAVIVLPDNKNIVMAAQTACGLAELPAAVVPTNSVPQAFSALFVVDLTKSLDENVQAMTEALADVHTGEITHAIKDSQDADGNPIKKDDVIGIADGAIKASGKTIDEVLMKLLDVMDAADADTLTILAGDQLSDDEFKKLTDKVEEQYDDLEVDAHRGDQPLYPLVFSVE